MPIARALAFDDTGAIYLAGATMSDDFPLADPIQPSWKGGQVYGDAFLTKLTPDGSELVYSSYLGGGGGLGDTVWDLAVASDGVVTFGGYTDSRDFPTTSGAYDETCVPTASANCEADGFVTRIAADGGSLIYSTLLGGSVVEGENGRPSDEVRALAIDAEGNAYLGGETTSITFPTTPGAFDREYDGFWNELFVAKLNPTGSTLVYSTYIGGVHIERLNDLVVDAAGRVTFIGTTDSTGYPLTPDALDASCGTGDEYCGNHFDAILTTVSADGSSLVYSTYLGGGISDEGNGIALDAAGNLVVTGGTTSSDFPLKDPIQAENRSASCFQPTCYDVFVTQFLAPDYRIGFSTLYGGSGKDTGTDVALGPDGDLLIGGVSASTDFPLHAAIDTSCAGTCEFVDFDTAVGDAFLMRLAPIPFTDIAESQFFYDILWLHDQAITTGCTAFLFCPNDSVTRGQMASFLARALDLPSTTTDFFTDDEASIHEVDINRAAAAGIASGCAVGVYCPTQVVTRAQMASFLARALNLPSTTTDYFTDDEMSIHEVDINRAAAAGLTSGCTATTYCPTNPVTRGQMAAFLHRALT